jgi:RNA polymerase-binding transcription factor DksA
MLKNELAQQLRERQYKLKFTPKSIIDALSDDQIINSYVTCSFCGESISEEQLAKAIHQASKADEFFGLAQPHRSDDSNHMSALTL